MGGLANIVKVALMFVPGAQPFALGFNFATFRLVASVVGFVAAYNARKVESGTDISSLQVQSHSTIESRKIIYGRTRISGATVFKETSDNNKNYHQCVVFANHEINAVKALFLNDDVVAVDLQNGVQTNAVSATSSQYQNNHNLYSSTPFGDSSKKTNYHNRAYFTVHDGTQTTADSNLVSSTTMDQSGIGNGVAYVHAIFHYDSNVFSNAPNISLIVEGKKLYDPRTQTTVYSNNAALCILDYLLSEDGLNVTLNDVNVTSFITAANICDEVVYTTTGDEKRYTIDGVVDTARAPQAILNSMCAACAGNLSDSGGIYSLHVGSYTVPTSTLTDDEIISDIKISTSISNSSNFNAVKGVYVSPKNNYQPADFPAITSTTFESEDKNERLFSDIKLEFTQSPSMAQRIANIALRRNREQVALEVTCNLSAYKYEFGDTLYYSNEKYGFNNKVFEVVDKSFNFDEIVTVTLSLKETSASIYAWNLQDEQVFSSNNTTLSDLGFVSPPVLSIQDSLRDFNESAVSVMTISITTNESFIDRHEIQVKDGNEWVNVSVGTQDKHEILNIEDGAIYYIRARTRNTIGKTSDWVEVSHQVTSRITLPDAPLNLTAQAVGSQLQLNWDAVTDKDLSHYVVRYAPNSTEYTTATILVEKVPRPATSVTVPLRAGHYFVKSVSKTALRSATAATISIDTELEINQNVVQTITDTTFSGTGGDIVDGTLRINYQSYSTVELINGVREIYSGYIGDVISGSATLLSSFSVNTILGNNGEHRTSRITGQLYVENGKKYNIKETVDNQIILKIDNVEIINNNQYNVHTETVYTAQKTGYVGIEFYAYNATLGGHFNLQMKEVDAFLNTEYYYLNNNIDLLDVYTSTVSSKVELTRLDTATTFDTLTGLFDSLEGLFDDLGGTNFAQDDFDAKLEYRATSDNPSSSPTWSDWKPVSVSSVNARAYEFRLKMISMLSTVTPSVTKITAIVDMPDRVISGSATTSGLTQITYAGFYSAPKISIGIDDMQSGDYYVITDKTKTGFKIEFKNSSDNTVARSFDYIARGHGIATT